MIQSPEMFESLARWVELAGVAIMLLGAVGATGRFLLDAGRSGIGGAYRGYRAHLGRAILIGLEFLVIADLIQTITREPTFRSLGLLAGVVLIRTFLSFTVEVEITGRWPWRAASYGDPADS